MDSLININPDFKLVIKALNRIAHALESYMLVAHGYRVTEDASGTSNHGGVSDVSYSDHESTMQQEIDVALKRKKSLDELDEDDE